MTTTYHYAQLYSINPQQNVSDDHIKSQQISVFQSADHIKHAIHVSPLLHFNLVNNLPKTLHDTNELFLRLIPLSQEQKNIRVSQDETNEQLYASVPSYAKEAQISLIQTAFTRPGEIFDKILEKYFSKPRLLTVGDILCISFDVSKDSMNSLASDEYHRLESNMIYFKVMKLVCSENESISCFVDTEHTTVYQVRDYKYLYIW
jgi:hypothetical protein